MTEQPGLPPLRREKGLTRHRQPLHALTGMRFIAAFWVVLHHSGIANFLAAHGLPYLANIFVNGYLAVLFFFLLSGFILAYTYRDQIESSKDLPRFWQARFARIWPTYMLSMLVSTVVHGMYFPSITVIVSSIFMVQGWNPWHVAYAGVWNGVCWTLTVEALFYVTFPWIQRFLEIRPTRHLLTLAATLAVFIILCNTATKGIGRPPYQNAFAHVPYPLLFLPEFILGVAMGNIFLNRQSHTAGKSTGLITYAGLIAGLAVLVFPSARWTSLVILGFSLLLYGLAAERTLISRFLSTRFMLLCGGLSYAMYLLQTSVKDLLESHLAKSIFNSILLVPVLFLASLLVYLFFEEPTRKLLRARFAAWDARKARLASSN